MLLAHAGNRIDADDRPEPRFPAAQIGRVTTVLARALNANLPDDLAVLDAELAPEAFHARFSARKRAYRYLLTSKLNTSRALVQIEQDPGLTSPEVRYFVEFIRSSQRGVILRRATRRAEEMVADE